jgi:hypothetical protein
MGEGLGVRAWVSNSIHIQEIATYSQEIAADIQEMAANSPFRLISA